MVRRREGWEAALEAAVAAARGRAFQWGEHDCATWAFEVRAAITGLDAARDWRGQYKSAIGARRVMKGFGWKDLGQLARTYLGRPLAHVGLAQRGDIVLAEGALGICVGAKAVFVAQSGVVERPVPACVMAWRV